MNIELDYFSAYQPDGKLYAHCIGDVRNYSITYRLYNVYEPGRVDDTKNAYGEALVSFDLVSGNQYYLQAQVEIDDGKILDLYSDIILLHFSSLFPPPDTLEKKAIKGKLEITSCDKLEFRIQFFPGGYKKLRHEQTGNIPFFHKVSQYIYFAPCFDEDSLQVMIKKFPLCAKLRELYRVEQDLANDELLLLARELEHLEYVEYCSLSGVPTADSSEYERDGWPQEMDVANVTPDLTQHQGYLNNAPTGMSVRAAWARNITGGGVGVRMQDTGYYGLHEDLVGNINVVSNSASNRTHGTSSAGIVGARNNGFGMTGIAFDSRIFAYSFTVDDLERIVRDALPGDIVTASLSWGRYPLIDNQHWWSLYRLLTQSGVVVVMSAGNVGINLLRSGMNDFGDSGVILATSSHPATGRRLAHSSFNFFRTIAAWGQGVATTGGGDLLNLGAPNRTYRNNYDGTSAAAPQVAAVLALLQSYAKSAYRVIFNTDQLFRIILDTGHREGEIDLIGPRPNAEAAVRYVDDLLSRGLLPPPVSRPPVMPPRYPFWRLGRQYEVGDRVTHLELFYQCRTRNLSNIGWQPNLAPTLWQLIS